MYLILTNKVCLKMNRVSESLITQVTSGSRQRNFYSKRNKSLHEAALEEIQYITMRFNNQIFFFLFIIVLNPEIYENII